jgi:cytochrome c553
VSGSPRTIAEAIALLNALPKPTSVACFVESLDRPLFAYATSSTISAQPALSFRSPRIFLRENQLLLSVVIEGPYSWLVEFSELIENDTRSIKGELLFPLAAAVAAAAPYDRIRYAQGTVCGTCHGSEERAPSVDFTEAFSSTAFRPNLTFRVSLDSLVHEQQICDPSVEPERCQLLSAIFAGGPVSEAQFSQTMTLFY